jgi:hypothetical protein
MPGRARGCPWVPRLDLPCAPNLSIQNEDKQLVPFDENETFANTEATNQPQSVQDSSK